MARRFGMALLWVSLLAVPLQTMAAAAMLLCISHGHPMALSMPLGGEMPPAATAPARDGKHTMVTDDLSDSANVNCGGETVCHPAIALLPSGLELPSAVPAGASGARLSTPAVRFFTSGPERPPRSSSLFA